MANTILLKRTSSSGSQPATGDLSLGEIAINSADGRLFSKLTTGDVVNIASQSVAGSVIPGSIQVGGEPGSPTGDLATVAVKSGGTTSATKALLVQTPSIANLFYCRDDGVVNIGAVNPDARLHVRGFGSTSATKALSVTDTDGVSSFVVRDDRKVGVNKASPNYQLVVRGSGASGLTTTFAVQSSAGADVFKIGDDGRTVISGTLQFAANPAGSLPSGQGTIIFERVSNTQVRLRMRGTDNVVRSAVLTLS
jgi:hypothetical protein